MELPHNNQPFKDPLSFSCKCSQFFVKFKLFLKVASEPHSNPLLYKWFLNLTCLSQLNKLCGSNFAEFPKLLFSNYSCLWISMTLLISVSQKLTGKENDPCSTQMLSDALAMWGDGNSDFRTGRQKQVLFPSGRVYLTCGLLSLKFN